MAILLTMRSASGEFATIPMSRAGQHRGGRDALLALPGAVRKLHPPTGLCPVAP